mgnify:FL=1|tara:strand:- start:19640 stop:20386 length:747 start_codon:yes stop_codon:yes gene_type:complete
MGEQPYFINTSHLLYIFFIDATLTPCYIIYTAGKINFSHLTKENQMTTFNSTFNPKVNFSKTLESMIDDIRNKLDNPITFRFHHVCAQTKVISEFMSTTVEQSDNYDYYDNDNDMEYEQKLHIAMLCNEYSNGKNKKKFRKLSLPLRRFISKFTKNKCSLATAQSRLWKNNEDGSRSYMEYYGIPTIDVFFTAIPETNPSDATKTYIEGILDAGCRSYYGDVRDGDHQDVSDGKGAQTPSPSPDILWN